MPRARRYEFDSLKVGDVCRCKDVSYCYLTPGSVVVVVSLGEPEDPKEYLTGVDGTQHQYAHLYVQLLFGSFKHDAIRTGDTLCYRNELERLS